MTNAIHCRPLRQRRPMQHQQRGHGNNRNGQAGHHRGQRRSGGRGGHEANNYHASGGGVRRGNAPPAADEGDSLPKTVSGTL